MKGQLIAFVLFVLLALGSFSTVFGEEWREKTDRDFVKVIHKLKCSCMGCRAAKPIEVSGCWVCMHIASYYFVFGRIVYIPD